MLCIPEQFRVFETSEPKNMEALGNAWAFSVWRGTYQRHICLDSVKAARTISTILIYIYICRWKLLNYKDQVPVNSQHEPEKQLAMFIHV